MCAISRCLNYKSSLELLMPTNRHWNAECCIGEYHIRICKSVSGQFNGQLQIYFKVYLGTDTICR